MGFYGFYILRALGSMMFNVREKSVPFQFSRHWRYRILVNFKSKLLFFSTFRFFYLDIAAEIPDTDPRRADARRYVAHKTNNAVWCGVTLPVLKVEKCTAISCWGGERSRASRRWTVAGAAGFWAEFLAPVVPSPFMLPGIQYPIRSCLCCWVRLGLLGSFEKI